MPEPQTIKRARRDAAEGKSPSTQAGEFVREQIHHIREGKHGARSAKQAVAIGLSEARRAGVPLAPPKKGGNVSRKAGVPPARRRGQHARRVRSTNRGSTNPEMHHRRDIEAGARGKKPSPKRSRARVKALRKEGRSAASRTALSRHARQAARKRGPRARSEAARKAARTRQRARA
jgi:hypothetical protein